MGAGALGFSTVFMNNISSAFAKRGIGHFVSFKNVHTGEVYSGIYRVGNYYIPAEFEKIRHVMRDHRVNKSRRMDPKLIDIISRVQKLCKCKAPVEVLSGYRSPETNAKLRRTTSGVAKKSYHIKGQAADIRMPNMGTRSLRNRARSIRAGGVGYYPRSGFVHVDTGDVRHWSS